MPGALSQIADIRDGCLSHVPGDGAEPLRCRRRLIGMRYASWVAVAGAAAALVGCAAVQVGPRAAPAGQRAVPAADAEVHQTPQQRAAADAAAIIGAFMPPPHAVRTGPLPVVRLAQPVDEPLSTNLVIRTGWWRVASRPQAVVSWIQAHKPVGFASSGGDAGIGLVTVGGTGVMWITTFTLPDVPGVLVERQLVAAVAADGPGWTAIRVDAYVVWLRVRPAAETIPVSARVVTITPVSGKAAADHQVTVTDPARVARIAAAVNALPLYPPRDPMWCDLNLPPGGGAALRLTFRVSAGSRQLAVVTAYQELCQLVDVVTGGKAMPSLDGAQTLIQRVMAIAGIRWPDFPAPGPTATSTADP